MHIARPPGTSGSCGAPLHFSAVYSVRGLTDGMTKAIMFLFCAEAFCPCSGDRRPAASETAVIVAYYRKKRKNKTEKLLSRTLYFKTRNRKTK